MLMSGSTIRPPFGSRASVSNTRSTWAGSRTAAPISIIENDGAAASIGRRNRSANGALCGLKTTASLLTRGAVCLSASSHLVPIENSKLVRPVRLPPGCARFGTRPWPTGSTTCVNTIGTAPFCSRYATVTGVLLAKTRSGRMANSSAARPLPGAHHAVAPRCTAPNQTRSRCGANQCGAERHIVSAYHEHADAPLRARRERPRRCCAAECGQQFPPSDGDCHTPLPCEVRKGNDTTPRACSLHVQGGQDAGCCHPASGSNAQFSALLPKADAVRRPIGKPQS